MHTTRLCKHTCASILREHFSQYAKYLLTPSRVDLLQHALQHTDLAAAPNIGVVLRHKWHGRILLLLLLLLRLQLSSWQHFWRGNSLRRCQLLLLLRWMPTVHLKDRVCVVVGEAVHWLLGLTRAATGADSVAMCRQPVLEAFWLIMLSCNTF